MWKIGRLACASFLVLFISGCVIQVPAPDQQVTREQVEAEIQAGEAADTAMRLTETCSSIATEMNAIDADLHAHFQQLELIFAQNPDLSGFQLSASYLANDALVVQEMSGVEREQALEVFKQRYEEFFGDVYQLCGWE